MWGYSTVAATLDAISAPVDRWMGWAGPPLTALAFGLAVYGAMWVVNELARLTDKRVSPTISVFVSILGMATIFVGLLLMCYAAVWGYNRAPEGYVASFLWVVAVLFILWVVGYALFFGLQNVPAGRRAAIIASGLSVITFATLLFLNPRLPDPYGTILALMMVISVPACGYWLYREFRTPKSDRPIARRDYRTPNTWPPLGPPEVTTHGDAQLADPRRHGRAMHDILGADKGIWFGRMTNSEREAAYIGDRHLLTVAPNRTGKGTCAIIPNILLDREHSIICIDPKGQNAAVTARARRARGKVYCLNPFGEHQGPPWNLPMDNFNPLAHLDINDPNVEADVAALTEALILTESKTQPYFDNSARDLVEVLILHALATKGKDATLLDMRAWISLPMKAREGQPTLLRVIVDMSTSSYPFIREMASRFLNDTKSVDEVVQSASNQTKFLSHRAIAACLSGNDFEMLDFKNERATLYVILPERYLDAYSRFLRLVVVSALNALRSRPGGVRTLLMMDEFARLGSLSTVEQAVGSSAGFNVQLWPFVQDLNQLQHLYPKRWDSFIANAGVVQWFTPNDKTTADYLAMRIGKTTLLATQTSEQTSYSQSSSRGGPSITGGRTTSASESEVATDFLSSQDLYNMPSTVQLLTVAGLKYPVCATREPYYTMTDVGNIVRESADPDPYHS